MARGFQSASLFACERRRDNNYEVVWHDTM